MNVTVVFGDGVVGTDAVILMVGDGTGMTVTDVDVLTLFPKVSVAVAVIR